MELGHSVLSSCEHGWQGPPYVNWKTAKEYGLKYLMSTEAYWVKDREEKDGTNCHIWIGAKNENGRQAINDALSEANITGFYRQARLDIPLILRLPKDDVWITSACVAGWKYDDAEDIMKRFGDHFGENFFLEVQYHDTEKQAQLNERILNLRYQTNMNIIMGCDSHYIFEKQAQDRTDYLISKGLEYPDEYGWFMDYPDGDTAYARFAKQGVLTDSEIKLAMEATNVFLQVEEYDDYIFNSEIKMPSLYPGLTQEERDAEYKRLIWQGWDEYKDKVPLERHEEYREEIQKEIDVVIETKMADYFIDNYHIIRKGKENGGWLTLTGRGSAVSFITNKLLGFTEVDRIEAPVKMYPERFMSAARILQSGSLPDIDFNVAPVDPFALAQQQILGEDHAIPMISYGTMQVSAAWKLYAKSQGVPYETANTVSNQIKKYENALKHADEDDKDDIDVNDYITREYRNIFAKSADYQGIISSWSIAPCSYLLYQGSIRKEIGLVRIKDHLCCLMDGKWAESCHFLKNDLLKVAVVELIYRAYERIGMTPPPERELRAMCPPDDPCWKLYATGCTVSLNQVEKAGTSARASAYKPTNISELSAFVAAIRPGFKSMYKIFESRDPFEYGVSAFDQILQTPEMPNSFCLYQEQEMLALNYAGIPMSECYTAIKNIAKKRVEKVLAYKEQFIKGFSESIIQDDGKSKEEAEALAHNLWQIIEDSSRYSFNASHSYCVSCDSLYSAWAKAHYPCEFYEVLLKICEKKGDKDKMNAAKEEAENYFNIKFPPFRFGQDNREIRAVPEEKIILNTLSSIKGFSKTASKLLYDCGRQEFTRFFDVLSWLDKRSFKSAKVIPLVKIDYFQDFGNIPELLQLIQVYDFFKQGSAKTIAKSKELGWLGEILPNYATGLTSKGAEAKSWTITDMTGLLQACEDYIFGLNIEDLDYRVKAENQNEILGYIDLTTNREEDRKKLYVMDVYELPDRFKGGIWKYKVKAKSIGSGKVSSWDVMPYTMNRNKLKSGDIILVEDWNKNPKGYFELYSYKKLISI